MAIHLRVNTHSSCHLEEGRKSQGRKRFAQPIRHLRAARASPETARHGAEDVRIVLIAVITTAAQAAASALHLQEAILRYFRLCVINRACPGYMVM